MADKTPKDLLQIFSIDELQDMVKEYASDPSPEGKEMYARIRSRLRRLTHDEIHPGEEMVTINVPLGVNGNPFTINEKIYAGECTVPACVAQVLQHQIYMNRKIDEERMQEGGNTKMGRLQNHFPMPESSMDLSAQIQAED